MWFESQSWGLLQGSCCCQRLPGKDVVCCWLCFRLGAHYIPDVLLNLLLYNINLFFFKRKTFSYDMSAALPLHNSLLSSGYFSPTPGLALGKLDSHCRACMEPHILLIYDSNLIPCIVKVIYLCVFKVEISYPTHAYYNIMPNQTLENLYENNAKALGIQFPEQPANFSGSWK